MEEGPSAQEEGARASQGRGEGFAAPPVSFPDIGALDHVTVTTPAELETEVVEFYRDVLRLEEKRKPAGAGERGAWFGAGRAEIHVTIDPHNPPRNAHFCLEVTDFSQAVDALRVAGCHIEQATTIPGRRRLFVRDPAGNKIEIAAYEDTA